MRKRPTILVSGSSNETQLSNPHREAEMNHEFFLQSDNDI